MLHKLTVAIFVLLAEVSGKCLHGQVAQRSLTKSENASLNSETCSSVRESAYIELIVSPEAYRYDCGVVEAGMAGLDLKRLERRSYHDGLMGCNWGLGRPACVSQGIKKRVCNKDNFRVGCRS